MVSVNLTAVHGNVFIIVIALSVVWLTCTDVSYVTELPNFKHIIVLRSSDCSRETYEI